MTTSAQQNETSYYAFLSYARADERIVAKFHRAIERYTLPPRLAGKETAKGVVPKKVFPLFRDKDELVADSDLSETLIRALAQSKHLVVFCSPRAAASHWVNQEIRQFRKLHPDRPILAVIVNGDPAARHEDDPENACFPPALIETEGEDTHREPLAVDLRPGHDPLRLARLKIIAAIIGLPLGALVQRDMARVRKQRVGISALAVSVITMLSYGLISAEIQRAKAVETRAEAEDLIEFMLTDFQEPLEKIDKLDALIKTGELALSYYQKQGIEALTLDQKLRFARALTLMGHFDTRSANYSQSEQRHLQAEVILQALVEDSPKNIEYLSDLTDVHFFLGDVYRSTGKLQQANDRYLQALELSQRRSEPSLDNGLAQIGYGNALLRLATLHRNDINDPQAALRYNEEALSLGEELASPVSTARPEAIHLLYFACLGLSNTYEALGSYHRAISYTQKAADLLPALHSAFDRNGTIGAIGGTLTIARSLGRQLRRVGRYEEALEALSGTTILAEQLVQRDPKNTIRLSTAHSTLITHVRIALRANRLDIAGPVIARIRSLYRKYPQLNESPTTGAWINNLAIQMAEAEFSQQSDDRDKALEQATAILKTIEDPDLSIERKEAARYLKARTLRVLALLNMDDSQTLLDRKISLWNQFLDILRSYQPASYTSLEFEKEAIANLKDLGVEETPVLKPMYKTREEEDLQ